MPVKRALVVKRLQASDLGWFEEPRTTGVVKGHQRGINLDASVMTSLFSGDQLDAGTIWTRVSYRTPNGAIVHEERRRPIKRQAKNWRLTGDKVPGAEFSGMRPGDYMLLLFDLSGPSISLKWEAFPVQESPGKRPSLHKYLLAQEYSGAVMLLAGQESEVFKLWTAHSKALFAPPDRGLTGSTPARSRVREVLENPNILSLMLSTTLSLSSGAQAEFLENLQGLVEYFQDCLTGDIEQVKVDHKNLWGKVQGQRMGFIDGGVASISALGTEPLAIRVGSYTVVPGETGDDREAFGFCPQLVEELFDTSGHEGTYDEVYEDTSKLRDMARITLETTGAVELLANHKDLKFLFLHGPLVNPVAPYADTPAFTAKALRKMGLNSGDVAKVVKGIPREGGALLDGQFIAVYRCLLASLFSSPVPIAGVIERSAGSSAFARLILEREKQRGNVAAAKEALETIKAYRVTDAILFACLLREGEFVRPMELDKNTLHKAPDNWKGVIESYPRPWTTYVRPTSESVPFRIEMNLSDPKKQRELLMLTVHMARLLPNYAFPVGLDIVDKHAKVPAWMSRQVSKHQAAQLLRHALQSGDPKLLEMAKLNLLGNKRDWLFRPRFDS